MSKTSSKRSEKSNFTKPKIMISKITSHVNQRKQKNAVFLYKMSLVFQNTPPFFSALSLLTLIISVKKVWRFPHIFDAISNK